MFPLSVVMQVNNLLKTCSPTLPLYDHEDGTLWGKCNSKVPITEQLNLFAAGLQDKLLHLSIRKSNYGNMMTICTLSKSSTVRLCKTVQLHTF